MNMDVDFFQILRLRYYKRRYNYFKLFDMVIYQLNLDLDIFCKGLFWCIKKYFKREFKIFKF